MLFIWIRLHEIQEYFIALKKPWWSGLGICNLFSYTFFYKNALNFRLTNMPSSLICFVCFRRSKTSIQTHLQAVFWLDWKRTCKFTRPKLVFFFFSWKDRMVCACFGDMYSYYVCTFDCTGVASVMHSLLIIITITIINYWYKYWIIIYIVIIILYYYIIIIQNWIML